MFLENTLAFLQPYSDLYGSGNAQVDLLIACAILSILCLLFVVKITLIDTKKEPTIFSRVLFPTQDLVPLNDLNKNMDNILTQLELFKQYTKQDLGFVTQEVQETKKAIHAVSAELSFRTKLSKPSLQVARKAQESFEYKKSA